MWIDDGQRVLLQSSRIHALTFYMRKCTGGGEDINKYLIQQCSDERCAARIFKKVHASSFTAASV